MLSEYKDVHPTLTLILGIVLGCLLMLLISGPRVESLEGRTFEFENKTIKIEHQGIFKINSYNFYELDTTITDDSINLIEWKLIKE